MYKSTMPSKDDLPSSAQLIKSTIIALVAAAAILVTIVLPAEYAIDPTGIGRVLNLTEMGEIKQQLAIEAEADRIKDRQMQAPQAPTTPEKRSSLGGLLLGFVVGAPAQAAEPVLLAQAGIRSDETTITLKPNEGTEYKMPLPKGAQVEYSWRAEGGPVNYDLHGSPSGGGKESSYKAARGVASDEGKLTAGYDGMHGWFFRNRGKADVTIKLRTKGPYAEIKKVM